ncbi:branched-chain amino acid ABC transporter permease [Agromyces aerolatus]|uniref:branched-chain amino acid ABC transporter permease n=1 Tax=Agromyces sp. LY-1074 TaxID=3074080 RepID=UPI00285FB7A5|nr:MULTISPECIES: branched-chain amino acid ABC transporter permease [unclassified Agromyces]MDR5699763.1 branched-chain amino acid ABC transporter permease [Agromyces sp. LY-1074]MDR5706059.1 branched-chain amino acid ABC transporter permease [Agromyces sp. LY-1358]
MDFFGQYDILIKTLLIYIVLGLSLQVVLRSGVFSLASAGFWGVSAYLTAILAKAFPDVAWLAFLVGPAVSLVLSGLLALLLRRLNGLYLGMATIAFALLVVAVAQNWTEVTGGSLGLYAIPQLMTVPIGLVITVVCVVLVALFHSRAAGRFADAMNVDEPLARSQGISTVRVRMVTFMFSAFLGAVSGAMYALTFSTIGPDDSGFSLIVLGLTIVVIGGSASWVGAVIGAIVVTLLPQFLGFMAEWRDLVYGLVVVVMMVFAPGGVLGLIDRLKIARRKGRSSPPPAEPPAVDSPTIPEGAAR